VKIEHIRDNRQRIGELVSAESRVTFLSLERQNSRRGSDEILAGRDRTQQVGAGRVGLLLYEIL
jgi:hypothetical protein